MKKIIFSLVVIILFNSYIKSIEIKNFDKPIKGSWDFKLKKIWSIENAGDYPLANLSKIKCDNNENIYTYDKKHKKLFVFNSKGKCLHNIGKKGEGPGEYRYVADFFLLKKYLIIVDFDKLHYFNNDGKYIKTCSIPNVFNQRPACFITNHQYVYSAKGTNNINIYNIEEKRISTIYGNQDKKGKKVLSKTKSGATVFRGSHMSEFQPRNIIEVDNNKILFGKNDLYKIESINLDGNKQFSFSIIERKKEKMSQKFRENEVKKKVAFTFSGLPADQVKKVEKSFMKEIPEYGMYFQKIKINQDKLIYVFLNNIGKLNYQELDIFSSKGIYLYKSKIVFPIGTIIRANGIVFDRDNLIVFLEDSEGESKLIKYKILLPSV